MSGEILTSQVVGYPILNLDAAVPGIDYAGKRYVDVAGWSEILRNIIETAEEEDGLDKKVLYTSEYGGMLDLSSEDFTSRGYNKSNTVTWNHYKRLPGLMAKGPPNSTAPRAIRPIQEDLIASTDVPGYMDTILIHPFDNWLTVVGWSTNVLEAQRLARWLESLLVRYTFYFKGSGIVDMWYNGQGDIRKREKPQILLGYPLDIWIRTYTVYTVRQKTIERLNVNLEISQGE